MQGKPTEQAGQGGPTAWAARRPDWHFLAVLLLLSAGIHAWLIATTAVTARDSIGYIRYALRLETEPWPVVMRSIQQHPLYSLAILGASYPVRWLQDGVTPQGMVLSAQLIAGVAGFLLVVPMFYLGRELFDHRVGFWAAALFQLLPICAQVTSDGLSDGLFLLMLTLGLMFGVQALRRQAPWRFVPSGLFIGLAYLTRPEGALVGVALLLVLLGVQCRSALRWPRIKWSQGVAGLVASAAVVALPYMTTIGGLTVKPATRFIFKKDYYSLPPAVAPRGKLEETRAPNICRGSGPLAVILGVWWIDEGQAGAPPWWWAMQVVAVESIHAFHYLAWLPALLGLWWFRDCLRATPGMWVLLLLSLMLALILGRLVARLGYMSERHTLVMVLCGTFWAAAALVRMADALPSWLERITRRPIGVRYHGTLSLAWLLFMTGWCLPATLKPLHANRTGFRAAGEWLATNALPADEIVDPFCWSHFYAGRVLQESMQPQPANRPTTCYVVVTNSKNAHNRLSGLAAARELTRQGTLVFCWTPSARQLKRYRAEEVQVYAVSPAPASAAP
jgi:hypothetical protein